jgi:hypothetical protein
VVETIIHRLLEAERWHFLWDRCGLQEIKIVPHWLMGAQLYQYFITPA